MSTLVWWNPLLLLLLTVQVYQSLPNPPSPDSDQAAGLPATRGVVTACPVLVHNILATHADTFSHARQAGCQDCFDYSNSVGAALPYLQTNPATHCAVHGVSLQCSVQPLARDSSHNTAIQHLPCCDLN